MTSTPDIWTDPEERRGRYIARQSWYIFVVILMFAIVNLQYEGGQQVYEPAMDNRIRERIDAEYPDTVMVGNSMLGQNVNPELFAELTDTKVLKMNVPGSASAVWYLMIKNQILAAEHRPRNIIILFRDRYICDPKFATTGAELELVERFASPHEPLLQELSYGNRIQEGGALQSMYLPLYSNRERIKDTFIDGVKYIPSELILAASRTEADTAVDNVFADENMNAERLTQAQLDADAGRSLDGDTFDEQVASSYLPEIIRMAKDNDIALHLIRVKTLGRAKGLRDSDRITNFVNDLNDYLRQRDVTFIDYSYEESIKPEHYAIGDHLRQPDGTNLFTRLMARDLGPLLKRDD